MGYCSHKEQLPEEESWPRAPSTMTGMSACAVWSRMGETAIFSSCVAQARLGQVHGLGGSGICLVYIMLHG